MIMFCTLRASLINMRHCHFCLHIDQLAGRQSPLIFAYFQLDNWSRNSGVFILGARCPLYSCQHSRAFYWQLINWPRGYTHGILRRLCSYIHTSLAWCQVRVFVSSTPTPQVASVLGLQLTRVMFSYPGPAGGRVARPGGGTSDTHPLSRKLLTKHRGRRVVSSRPKFPENWAPHFSNKNI